MRVHALIPVKELAQAKSRLTPPFTGDERAALVLAMLYHVILAAQECDLLARIIVISPDPTVLDHATAWGVATLRQRTIGLNAALDEARADAVAHGADAVLALHADLPHARPDEIARMIALLPSPPAAVIAPDYTGTGTNALLVAPPDSLPFHFGTASFAAHVAAAEQRGLRYVVAHLPGIAGDVDTPEDARTLAERIP